jgi:hypothetical protein
MTDKIDQIQIFDDFFLEDDLKKIVDYFNNVGWKCQCDKSPNQDITTDKPFWRKELEKEPLFSEYFKEIIEQRLFQKKCKLNRIYAVGQTYGQDSNYHPDDYSDTNLFTFCFYINDHSDENSDGFFYIKVPNKKYRICIEPYMNRAVLFPSHYIHKGTGFNIWNDQLRICIAWKYKII